MNHHRLRSTRKLWQRCTSLDEPVESAAFELPVEAAFDVFGIATRRTDESTKKSNAAGWARASIFRRSCFAVAVTVTADSYHSSIAIVLYPRAGASSACGDSVHMRAALDFAVAGDPDTCPPACFYFMSECQNCRADSFHDQIFKNPILCFMREIARIPP